MHFALVLKQIVLASIDIDPIPNANANSEAGVIGENCGGELLRRMAGPRMFLNQFHNVESDRTKMPPKP